MKVAEPIGTFGGGTDFIVRFRKGELTGADTGNQGEGQTRGAKLVRLLSSLGCWQLQRRVIRAVTPLRID
jgi:hypothetical protein